MTRDPILVVAKRAVIADQRGAEFYDKSSSYGETTAASVLECNERFSEVCATWEEFVETYLPFGLAWANELLRLAKASPEDRKAAFDKRNEDKRQARITSGQSAPRIDVSVDDEGTIPGLSPSAEKKRKQRAKKGKKDKAPLAPIEHRRLVNELKAKLVTLNMKQLREAEALLHEAFFAKDVTQPIH